MYTSDGPRVEVVELTFRIVSGPRSRPGRVAGVALAAACAAAGLAACAEAPPPPPRAAAEWPRLQTAAADPPPIAAQRQTRDPARSMAGSYLAGRFAQKRRDFTEAAKLLSMALGVDPENPGLLRATFLAHLAAGRMDSARKLASRLAALDGPMPLAELVLAVGAARVGAFDEAETRLGSVSPSGLNLFLTPLLSVWAQLGQGKVESALTALDETAPVSGLEVVHHYHTGLVLDFAGRADEAERRYLAAVGASAPPAVRLVEAVGSFYERGSRPGKARTLYSGYRAPGDAAPAIEHALSRLEAGSPAPPVVGDARQGMAEVFFSLSGALFRDNTLDLALIYGRLALDLRPRFPHARLLVGRMLESADRFEDAIAVYGGVAESSPLKWSARLRRAEGLDELGRTEEAVAALRRMAYERPERADALSALGDVLRAKKRFGEAVAAYDAALDRVGPLERRHWRLLYSRGIALERSRRWPRAEADFLAALELNPDQPYVLNYLAYSWVEQGVNLERAREMIDRAVERRPGDGYIVDSQGWVLYRLGRHEEAVARLEQAVELRPQDPTINDHLGDAYWRVGRRVEARSQWRRALSLGPEPEAIDGIRAKIARGLDRPAAVPAPEPIEAAR